MNEISTLIKWFEDSVTPFALLPVQTCESIMCLFPPSEDMVFPLPSCKDTICPLFCHVRTQCSSFHHVSTQFSPFQHVKTQCSPLTPCDNMVFLLPPCEDQVFLPPPCEDTVFPASTRWGRGASSTIWGHGVPAFHHVRAQYCPFHQVRTRCSCLLSCEEMVLPLPPCEDTVLPTFIMWGHGVPTFHHIRALCSHLPSWEDRLFSPFTTECSVSPPAPYVMMPQ